MLAGVQLLVDAVTQEYVDCLISSLPKAFVCPEVSSFDAGSSQSASLQMHHFSPLPEWISMVSEDVIPSAWKLEHWSGNECNSSIVQRYKPGEGIRWHVDLLSFGDGVAILSLLSTVKMMFRRVNDHSIREDVILPPNSLLLLSREARYDWEHTIESVTGDLINGKYVAREERISFTLRRIDVDHERTIEPGPRINIATQERETAGT